MKNLWTAVVAVIVLSGCAGSFVDQRGPYEKVKPQEITTKDGTYIVKIADGKALVRPSVATAFGEIAIVPHSRDAVKKALPSNCRITEGYPNGDFFEFTYVCK